MSYLCVNSLRIPFYIANQHKNLYLMSFLHFLRQVKWPSKAKVYAFAKSLLLLLFFLFFIVGCSLVALFARNG